jgi:hypothetical protein
MKTHGEALTKLLFELKVSEGKNLNELIHCLPDEYTFIDYDLRYLALESLLVLLDWGLVEAYQNNKICKISELKFDRWSEIPEDIKFYLSKQAIDIEQTLGISFSSSTRNLFSDSKLLVKHFPKVFVLMPFIDKLKHVYEKHIKKVFESSHFTIGRADDFFSNGMIMSDIWTAIRNARIIVADCTDRNPNVFYEIGISHTLGKETILISQNINDIPFDLRHLRIIIYKDSRDGLKILEANLKNNISSLFD